MSRATTILREEHDAILRMLDATEEVARSIAAGGHPAQARLANILEFFRLFADRCHHGKEEGLLFPLLEQKGLPRAGGPIGVMLAEHEEGRGYVGQMAEAIEAYGRDPVGSGRQWMEAARNYSALLRQHIHKENNVLFMVAENLLSHAEQEELAAAFEKVEEEKIGAGTHKRLHALMEKLTAEVLA